jgi:hypothetical protein
LLALTGERLQPCQSTLAQVSVVIASRKIAKSEDYRKSLLRYQAARFADYALFGAESMLAWTEKLIDNLGA